ncbi:hypothetical protein LCGC14_2112570 [marine sediment metagenome]|uniref:Uncharacterized protein n=1 Tax=marine sediment metagenome TaxID=412755 RepID=A0A0F9E6L5_9ZZZZ
MVHIDLSTPYVARSIHRYMAELVTFDGKVFMQREGPDGITLIPVTIGNGSPVAASPTDEPHQTATQVHETDEMAECKGRMKPGKIKAIDAFAKQGIAVLHAYLQGGARVARSVAKGMSLADALKEHGTDYAPIGKPASWHFNHTYAALLLDGLQGTATASVPVAAAPTTDTPQYPAKDAPVAEWLPFAKAEAEQRGHSTVTNNLRQRVDRMKVRIYG